VWLQHRRHHEGLGGSELLPVGPPPDEMRKGGQVTHAGPAVTDLYVPLADA